MSNGIARNSNIELLRIVAMFLIVQSHFATHGYMAVVDGDLLSIDNALNRFWIVATTTGNIGNGLFMLITGYFLSQSHSFNLRRFLRVVIQVLTYSVLCYLGYTVWFNDSNFTFYGILEACSPLIHGTYWYFTSYILVYLFHPFLNVFISCLSQKQFGIVIVLMAVVWGIVPSLLLLEFEKSGFLVFCLFYFIGAYFRRYYSTIDDSWSQNIWLRLAKTQIKRYAAISCLIWLVFGFVSAWLTPFYRFVYMASPLVIVLSVFLFLFFLNCNIFKSSKVINSMAGCMGGVYLLSDNPYMRKILYTNLFYVDDIIEDNRMLAYTIVFVLLTILICVCVEFLRKQLYDATENLWKSRFFPFASDF